MHRKSAVHHPQPVGVDDGVVADNSLVLSHPHVQISEDLVSSRAKNEHDVTLTPLSKKTRNNSSLSYFLWLWGTKLQVPLKLSIFFCSVHHMIVLTGSHTI